MQVVSSTEFATQQEKFFLMAHHQRVLVQSGNYTYRIMPEPVAVEQMVLQPDEKLRNAITGDELLEGIYQDLETFFAGK